MTAGKYLISTPQMAHSLRLPYAILFLMVYVTRGKIEALQAMLEPF